MDQSAFVMPDGFGSEVKVKGDFLREVRICHVVHKYNETMEGVDVGDQLMVQYEP